MTRRAPVPEKSVTEAMAEADTLRTLTRSGGLRIVKHSPEEEKPAPPVVEAKPAETVASVSPESKKEEVAPAQQPAEPIAPRGFTFFRRKTKMADVARIIPSPPPPAVVPPSFPVTASAGNILEKTVEDSAPAPAIAPPIVPQPVPASFPTPPSGSEEKSPVTAQATETSPPKPSIEEKPAPPPTDSTPPPEKTEQTAASVPVEPMNQAVTSREKQEFILANGERILGRILSETADTLYLNHDTLGVLTIPRAQLAKRLIEIILINGDRIVGDVVAENPECLYVRHASLGMLTLPRAQRSTRVVEAILKDGDRILGEVLAETENFTVIRSATLGTVAVQHTQVAMLNRKIEQIQLKALPPAAPENKPSA